MDPAAQPSPARVTSSHRQRLWVMAGVLLCWSAAATAQTVYKWTDEHGIVNFSDTPPEKAKSVERREMPPPRPAQPATAGSTEPGGTGTSGEPGSGDDSKTRVGEGPAKIVLVSSETPRTGPSTMHVRGKVKNVGGAEAQEVGVMISANDSGQGNPCLNANVGVSPPTLRSGETGSFDIDLDSPCLNGNPRVDLAPIWQ